MWRFFIDNILVDEPIGWGEMQIVLRRDPDLHGIFPEYSFDSLKFRCSGFDYLWALYNTSGVGATASLRIEYQCAYTDPFVTYWDGKISLTDVQFVDGESLAVVTIWKMDLASLVNARFSVPVDVTEPLTLDGVPVGNNYEAVNKFPFFVKANDIAQPLTSEYRASLSSGYITRMVGTTNHTLVIASLPFTFNLSGGKTGVNCNFDTYDPLSTYPQDAIVMLPPPIFPVGANLFRAINFVPLSTPPPNPLFWINIPYTAEEDNGYKAENFLRRYVSLYSPAGIGRLSAGAVTVGYWPKMLDPATQPLPVGASTWVTGPTGSLSDGGAIAWLRPNISINNLTSIVPPNPGITSTYTVQRAALPRNDAYGASSCAPLTGATQTAANELFVFQADRSGLYSVDVNLNINTQAIVGAATAMQTSTSAPTGINCDAFPSGCVCPNNPVAGLRNDFIGAELWWTVRIGSFYYTPWAPGPCINLASGPICSRHAGNFAHENANHVSWNTTISISGQFAIPVNQGISIGLHFKMYGRASGAGVPQQRIVYGLAVIDVEAAGCVSVRQTTEFNYPNDASIPVYPPYELTQRILDKITENSAILNSSLLGRPDTSPAGYTNYGCGSMTGITQGYFIRGGVPSFGPSGSPVCNTGLPLELTDMLKRGFPLSLKDVFEAFDAIYCVGLGIDGQNVFLESREFFYSPAISLVISAGDKKIRNLTRKVDLGRVYNKFISGYSNWQSDDTEGLNEYNSQRTWNMRIENVKNELVKECGFIASAYLIELTRRQALAVTGSSGWKYDESVFLFQIADYFTPDGPVAERGVLSPVGILNAATQLNFRLRPSSMLRRWLPWLAQTVFHNPLYADFIVPGKISGNVEAGGADLTSPVLPAACNYGFSKEKRKWNANEGVSLPYLRPEIVSFETKLSISEFNIIKSNPYSSIQVNFDSGPPLIGNLNSIAYNPTTFDAQIELIPRL